MTNYNETFIEINDLFLGIDGEGIGQGEPSLFLIFQGCSLKCKYCNRTETKNKGEGKTYSIYKLVHDEIIPTLKKYENIRRIVFTGGNAVEQDHLEDLVKYLILEFYKNPNIEKTRLHLEHNGIIDSIRGSADYSDDLNKLRMFNSIQFSIKTPEHLQQSDEDFKKHVLTLVKSVCDLNKTKKRDINFKFTITSKNDIDYYLNIINSCYQLKQSNIIIQPCFDRRNRLNDKVVENMLRIHELVINNKFGKLTRINININKALGYRY